MANLVLLVQGEIEELFSHIHQVIVNSRLAREKITVKTFAQCHDTRAGKGSYFTRHLQDVSRVRHALEKSSSQEKDERARLEPGKKTCLGR
jgi:hypothetical protein